MSRKFGGIAPVVLHEVHRRHRQSRPVHAATHVAVELDEAETRLAGPSIGFEFRARIHERGDGGAAEEFVIVDADLGVDRLDLTLGRRDEGVDLGHRGTVAEENVVELRDDLRALSGQERIAVKVGGKVVGLVRHQAVPWIDAKLVDRPRVRGRDFFDVDTTFGRHNEDRTLLFTVHENPHVGLRGDALGGGDQNAFNG